MPEIDFSYTTKISCFDIVIVTGNRLSVTYTTGLDNQGEWRQKMQKPTCKTWEKR
jgi:hypothetical protein